MCGNLAVAVGRRRGDGVDGEEHAEEEVEEQSEDVRLGHNSIDLLNDILAFQFTFSVV